MIFGLPIRLWLVIGAAAAILAALYFFGNARYAQGVSAENARWEAGVRKVTEQAVDIAADEGQHHRQRTAEISGNLGAGLEQIESASHENAVAFLSAWAGADRRLCNAGCAG